VPRALNGLGVPPVAIREHIGWDIGAAAVTRLLAMALDAPALLSGYSRLVVDCNRDPDDRTSIPAESDGVAVPGNRDLSPEARIRRLEACFAPYHMAIAARLDAFAAAGVAPAFLSVHSFTPVMKGMARPWHVGILWDKDPRIPKPLLAALGADPSITVGDNEPYSAREPAGFTVRYHASCGRISSPRPRARRPGRRDSPACCGRSSRSARSIGSSATEGGYRAWREERRTRA
jgi:predicted N-formylglutamate amidohydrolase